MKQSKTCILFTSDNQHLSEAAEIYTRNLFNVQFVGRYDRRVKHFPKSLISQLTKMKVDYLFNFLSPVIVPRLLLETIKVASINFHPAPPKWPGIGSPSFALYENDKTFGVTAHHMTQKIDAGPIIQVLHFPILLSDTCDSLFARALNYSLILFYEVLKNIDKTGRISTSSELWQKKALTRKQFERFMTLSVYDSSGEIKRKIKAVRSHHFPGPFLSFSGYTFQIPPASPTLK